MSAKTKRWRAAAPFGLGAVLMLAACSPGAGTQNKQQVVGNAITADEQIVGAADDRADHLDELSAELAAEADRVGGAEGQALRNRSDAALKAAAEARAQGQASGADAAEQIEQKAGILNKQ